MRLKGGGVAGPRTMLHVLARCYGWSWRDFCDTPADVLIDQTALAYEAEVEQNKTRAGIFRRLFG